jgi:hypothetical protein
MGEARNLILELGKSMGLGNLSFDANNITGIQFDNLAVNIHADPEAGEVTFFVAIGDIPPQPAAKAAIYAFMLKSNNFSRHTGGGVLGVDEEEKTACFSHRFPTASLTVAQLERILEAFLNLADAFAAGFRQAATETMAEDAAVPPDGIRA